MSHPNPDRDERVKEIRERLETVRYSPMFAKSAVVTMESYQAALRDVDTLLSLLDGQAAATNRHGEEVAADIVCEWSKHDMNEHYGSDYLQDEFGAGHLEERIALALTDAATRMRDRCVQKVRERASEVREVFTGGQSANDAVQSFARLVLNDLEFLTLGTERESD